IGGGPVAAVVSAALPFDAGLAGGSGVGVADAHAFHAADLLERELGGEGFVETQVVQTAHDLKARPTAIQLSKIGAVRPGRTRRSDGYERARLNIPIPKAFP